MKNRLSSQSVKSKEAVVRLTYLGNVLHVKKDIAIIAVLLKFHLSGHYCPTGSSEPIRCDSGSYQDEIGQSGCKDCPEGFYCDNTEEPVVLYNNSMCPTGL